MCRKSGGRLPSTTHRAPPQLLLNLPYAIVAAAPATAAPAASPAAAALPPVNRLAQHFGELIAAPR